MASVLVTTPANVKGKGWIELDDSSTTYDEWITGAIAEVSTAFESYISRDLLKASRAEVYDMEIHQLDFRLRHYPVDSVTEVKKRRHVGLSFDTEGILVDPDQFDFDAETGTLILRPPQTVWGPRTLRVTYTGGFGTDQADLEANFPEITSAANRQIAWMFQRKSTPGAFSQSIAGEATKVDMEVKLLATVRETLDKYRSWSI